MDALILIASLLALAVSCIALLVALDSPSRDQVNAIVRRRIDLDQRLFDR